MNIYQNNNNKMKKMWRLQKGSRVWKGFLITHGSWWVNKKIVWTLNHSFDGVNNLSSIEVVFNIFCTRTPLSYLRLIAINQSDRTMTCKSITFYDHTSRFSPHFIMHINRSFFRKGVIDKMSSFNNMRRIRSISLNNIDKGWAFNFFTFFI